jgi:Thioesterase-like superfamily
MSQEPTGVYLPGDTVGTYTSTELANAGWYDEGQHGGAFAALIAGHVELTVPTLARMEVSRLTVEIFRVIPLVDLRIETEVIREGKRIQSVEARVYDPAGTLLSVATIQRLRVADLPAPDDARPPAGDLGHPDDADGEIGDAWGVGDAGKTMFHRNAMEVREVFGGFREKGPGGVWMRLKVPIVAGVDPTPLQRVVATADFCNGVSRGLDFHQWVFMNPDLTVHIARYPSSDWVGLSAESGYGDLGRGVATGKLWDLDGWLGRSTQSLYLDRLDLKG